MLILELKTPTEIKPSHYFVTENKYKAVGEMSVKNILAIHDKKYW